MGEYPSIEELAGLESILEESAVAYAGTPLVVAFVRQVREGFPKSAALAMARHAGLSVQELAGLLHVSMRTLQRMNDTQRFGSLVSDRVLQLARVFALGMATFDGEEALHQWLREGVPAMGGAAPLSYLDTSFGIQQVYDELGRLQYGVYS
jgi:putative toxin-antitoxin system antitoxin component (TIGR02293 family)